MRRRHIKKLALNAKKDRVSIPPRGTVCSKKLRRRRKAWDRAGRAIFRQDLRRLEGCRQFLIDVRDCNPESELERVNLEKWEKMAVAKIARMEKTIAWKKGRGERERVMRKIEGALRFSKEGTWAHAAKGLIDVTALLGDFSVVTR